MVASTGHGKPPTAPAIGTLAARAAAALAADDAAAAAAAAWWAAASAAALKSSGRRMADSSGGLQGSSGAEAEGARDERVRDSMLPEDGLEAEG